jgi:hypothetical protein
VAASGSLAAAFVRILDNKTGYSYQKSSVDQWYNILPHSRDNSFDCMPFLLEPTLKQKSLEYPLVVGKNDEDKIVSACSQLVKNQALLASPAHGLSCLFDITLALRVTVILCNSERKSLSFDFNELYIIDDMPLTRIINSRGHFNCHRFKPVCPTAGWPVFTVIPSPTMPVTAQKISLLYR